MSLNFTGNVSPSLVIIGELDAGAIFTADSLPGQGVIFAGSFMKYDPATKTLSKAVIGTDAIAGLLADDIDTGPVGITEVQPCIIYRRGVFLRQQIETINNVTLDEGSALDLELSDLGISLVLSYE